MPLDRFSLWACVASVSEGGEGVEFAIGFRLGTAPAVGGDVVGIAVVEDLVTLSFLARMSLRDWKESLCISRVSIACSGMDLFSSKVAEWDLERCLRRRKKRASNRRRATRARAPRAMPTFAPVERPLLVLEDVEVVAVVVVGDAVELEAEVVEDEVVWVGEGVVAPELLDFVVVWAKRLSMLSVGCPA